MIKILMVGLGGFAGSICRFIFSGFVQGLFKSSFFPYGTIFVNITGCFLIGLLAGMSQTRHYFNPELRLFLLVGLLGGFTTFSTFSSETLSLINDEQFPLALVNVFTSVLLGLLAVWLGNSISSFM